MDGSLEEPIGELDTWGLRSAPAGSLFMMWPCVYGKKLIYTAVAPVLELTTTHVRIEGVGA